jgi:hypothetical protein
MEDHDITPVLHDTKLGKRLPAHSNLRVLVEGDVKTAFAVHETHDP